MADAAGTGVLRGNTITLDAPVPALEGRRVRVIIAPEDIELSQPTDEQAGLWDEWVRQGPKGPIEDEGEQEFSPDESASNTPKLASWAIDSACSTVSRGARF